VLIIFSTYTKISKNTAIANESISKLCKYLRKNDERVKTIAQILPIRNIRNEQSCFLE